MTPANLSSLENDLRQELAELAGAQPAIPRITQPKLPVCVEAPTFDGFVLEHGAREIEAGAEARNRAGAALSRPEVDREQGVTEVARHDATV